MLSALHSVQRYCYRPTSAVFGRIRRNVFAFTVVYNIGFLSLHLTTVAGGIMFPPGSCVSAGGGVE